MAANPNEVKHLFSKLGPEPNIENSQNFTYGFLPVLIPIWKENPDAALALAKSIDPKWIDIQTFKSYVGPLPEEKTWLLEKSFSGFGPKNGRT
jgi:hypothetical protein